MCVTDVRVSTVQKISNKYEQYDHNMLIQQKSPCYNYLLSFSEAVFKVGTLHDFFFICSAEKQLLGENVTQCDWHFTDLAGASRSTSSSPSGGGSAAASASTDGHASPKYQQHYSVSSLPSNFTAAEDTVSSNSVATFSISGSSNSFDHANSSVDLHSKHRELQSAPHSTPSSPVLSPHLLSNNQRSTPPSTPNASRVKTVSVTKYPSTPPPKKKMLLFPDAQPITKSKSHESQLANRVVDIDPVK